jgi:hypothetical protein
VEWPELLRRYSEALRQYASWIEAGCVGEPPAPVDTTGVRGPVPEGLRPHAAELATQTAMTERAVADRLATLRTATGHPAPMRKGYEQRPMPRYLDAMG